MINELINHNGIVSGNYITYHCNDALHKNNVFIHMSGPVRSRLPLRDLRQKDILGKKVKLCFEEALKLHARLETSTTIDAPKILAIPSQIEEDHRRLQF